MAGPNAFFMQVVTEIKEIHMSGGPGQSSLPNRLGRKLGDVGVQSFSVLGTSFCSTTVRYATGDQCGAITNTM